VLSSFTPRGDRVGEDRLLSEVVRLVMACFNVDAASFPWTLDLAIKQPPVFLGVLKKSLSRFILVVFDVDN